MTTLGGRKTQLAGPLAGPSSAFQGFQKVLRPLSEIAERRRCRSNLRGLRVYCDAFEISERVLLEMIDANPSRQPGCARFSYSSPSRGPYPPRDLTSCYGDTFVDLNATSRVEVSWDISRMTSVLQS